MNQSTWHRICSGLSLHPTPKSSSMALTKCKECSASIADSAERCPACGYVLTHPNTRNWFEILTSLSGPLVVSVAGTVLAYMTFVHQAETQETQELQTMVESAVSNDPVKERTAV